MPTPIRANRKIVCSNLVPMLRVETPSKTHKWHRGFTLIEIIVLIVFISIALLGVLSAYLHAMRTSSDPMIAIRAVELGQAYLDEILAKRFDENSGQGGVPRCDSTDPGALACTLVAGTEGEATRADFDDVDDYHDPVDTAPTDINGIALANYASYLVAIAVAYAGADVGLGANGAKRITVTVTSPKGHTFNIDAYRVNF